MLRLVEERADGGLREGVGGRWEDDWEGRRVGFCGEELIWLDGIMGTEVVVDELGIKVAVDEVRIVIV